MKQMKEKNLTIEVTENTEKNLTTESTEITEEKIATKARKQEKENPLYPCKSVARKGVKYG